MSSFGELLLHCSSKTTLLFFHRNPIALCENDLVILCVTVTSRPPAETMPAAKRKKKPAAKPKARGGKKANSLPRKPPNAYVLWVNTEGREATQVRYPSATHGTVMSLCGAEWNGMTSAQKAKWNGMAAVLRSRYQEAMQLALGCWTPEVGNACLVYSSSGKKFVDGFIKEERSDGNLRIVYEVNALPREKHVEPTDPELKPWEPHQFGACQVFSRTAGGWTDAIIESIDASGCTVHFEHEGELFEKAGVTIDDRTVLRWPSFADGELLLNVGRFRKLFSQASLVGEREVARKFCQRYFRVPSGAKPAKDWKWAGE